MNIVSSLSRPKCKRVSARSKLIKGSDCTGSIFSVFFLFSVSCLVSGKNQQKLKLPSRGFTDAKEILIKVFAKARGSKHTTSF